MLCPPFAAAMCQHQTSPAEHALILSATPSSLRLSHHHSHTPSWVEEGVTLIMPLLRACVLEVLHIRLDAGRYRFCRGQRNHPGLSIVIGNNSQADVGIILIGRAQSNLLASRGN